VEFADGGAKLFEPELGSGEPAIVEYVALVGSNHLAVAGPLSFDMSTVTVDVFGRKATKRAPSAVAAAQT
jgi:hypothetical protein